MLGFQDETWWSRTAQPNRHSWTEADAPLRLEELSVADDDPDPKALACYGLLARQAEGTEQVWLRFAEGQPISALTTMFLAWCCEQVAALGKTALLLVWDNAPWHISRAVRAWIREHNRTVKQTQHGVRIVVCYLPIKSPWLNPIEPKWVHGKRRVMAADRVLSAVELRTRVYDAFACPHHPLLSIPEKVA